jgi:hypothetical protein
VPRFDPLDPGFRARREAVDALFKPWTLINQLGALPRPPAVVLLLNWRLCRGLLRPKMERWPERPRPGCWSR